MSRGENQRRKQSATSSVNSSVSSEDEEPLHLLFPSKNLPSLEIVESFARVRHDSDNSDELMFGHKLRTQLHVPKHETSRVSDSSQNSNPVVPRSRSRYSVTAGTVASTRHSEESKRRKRRRAEQAHLFSDLDIQVTRPPMLHRINMIELLWLHNTGSRLSVLIGGLLACFFICHLVVAIWFLSVEKKVDNPNICTTPACIALGNRIEQTLNRSVNPCEDFYAFVCGSSKLSRDLTSDQESNWNYGNDGGRLDYDFDRSVSLGRMLQRYTDKFPHNLVLTLYQACLQEDEREKRGVQPYYDLLKRLNLYDVNKNKQLTKEHAIDSMARVLSHSLTWAAMISVHYYKDPIDYKIKAFISPSYNRTYRSGFVYRYGYQLYFDTVKTAFTVLDKLQFTTNAERDIVAHDIVCFELYLRDLYIAEDKPVLEQAFFPYGEDYIAKPECELGTKYTGTSPKANFGNPGCGKFDYQLLMKKMYAVANPGWNPNTDQLHPDYDLSNPQGDKKSDAGFLKLFEKVFENSAPIRLSTVRIQNCFHCIFRGLPFLGADTFHRANTEIATEIVDKAFREHSDRLKSAYVRMIVGSKFRHFRQYTERELKLTHSILLSYFRLQNVPPTSFRAKHFPLYPLLYEGLTLNKNTHFANLVEAGYRVHQWRANPKYASIFFDFHPIYHEVIWIDKPRSGYNGLNNYYTIYSPLASVEAPFLHDGIAVSDFGGIGSVISESNQKGFIDSLERKKGIRYLKRLLIPEFTADEIEMEQNNLKDYVNLVDNIVVQGVIRWPLGDYIFQRLKYDSSRRRLLDGILNDISRFQVLSAMVVEFLNDPANKREANVVLKGLEEFDALQLFYITLVGRECKKFGITEFNHTSYYGPLPQTLRNNVVISNLDVFARAFNCPTDSRMNPSRKVYLWDKDLNITEYNTTYPAEFMDFDVDEDITVEAYD